MLAVVDASGNPCLRGVFDVRMYDTSMAQLCFAARHAAFEISWV